MWCGRTGAGRPSILIGTAQDFLHGCTMTGAIDNLTPSDICIAQELSTYIT